MGYTAQDLADAQSEADRDRDNIQAVRNELDFALVTSGAWRSDAVDRLVSEQHIDVSEEGKIQNVALAVQRYRRKHPSDFVQLQGRAASDKLRPYERYNAAYKEILKVRERWESMQRVYERFAAKEK